MAQIQKFLSIRTDPDPIGLVLNQTDLRVIATYCTAQHSTVTVTGTDTAHHNIPAGFGSKSLAFLPSSLLFIFLYRQSIYSFATSPKRTSTKPSIKLKKEAWAEREKRKKTFFWRRIGPHSLLSNSLVESSYEYCNKWQTQQTMDATRAP